MPETPPAPPAISLLVTVYNRAKFVAAAIGSILRQTRRDFEVIVWNDASTDDSLEVARRAAGDDPRVKIIHAEHQGFSKSLNAAAKHATGKYFGWVDSDDALMPTALEETTAILDREPNVGMVYTDYLAMDEDGRVRGAGKRTAIPFSKDRLLVDFMTFHFRLMRREWFDRAGGIDESFETAQDYDLCLKLSELTEIRHLARPLYLYRVHPDTVSAGRRLEQIMASQEAIRRALARRGLDKEMEIDVEIVGKFRLKPKPKSKSP